MKYSEIIGLSTEDLVAKIAVETDNLKKMRFAHSVSAIENPSRIGKLRKDIARLNTELTKVKAAEATTTESN